tara:strand:+ start:407 stop:676 length:270 start_codon:yes stop_codon:yes gene_type:complete
MAVGDIVNGFGGNGVRLDFQPAVGISILISAVGGSTNAFGLTNGVVDSDIKGSTSFPSNLSNMKFFINNTNYLYAVIGNYRSYTGIQIQ